MRKLIFMALLMSLLFIGTVFGYGDNGPLYVAYYEKYNITGNTTGDGLVSSTIESITGYIVINNTGTTINDTLYDVWVAVNISNNITGPEVYVNGTPKGVFIESSAPAYTNLPNANTYIHIPILPNNSYVIIKFAIDKSITGVPLIINETYSDTKIPSERLSNWSVYLNISRNVSALPATDTPVSVIMTKYLSNDPNNYGSDTWNFLNITGAIANEGSITLWDGPYFLPGYNDSLTWTGVVINTTKNATITINITGNNTYTNRTGTLMKYGFAVIFFEFNGTKSGTKIEGIYATGYGGVSATKEGPFLNASSGKYEIWYESANVSNKASSYYFNLTHVTIWAVNGSNPVILDPFNITLLIPNSKQTSSPNEILSPGSVWSSTKYAFTFDGIPVVWANCTFKVADENITLINRSINEYSTKYGSSYVVVEEIYVVGSYLIKVTKHIVPDADGTYDIYIVVENIGSVKTPEYVYVYDLIPKNFTVSDEWVNQSSMLIAEGNHTITTNPRYNLSMWWALHAIYPGADGDGNWNDTAEILANKTVVIHYKLNGTGEFYPSDAFIVGIDPTNSLLPTTSPKITTVAGTVENNSEPFLALLTLLVGLGIIIRRVM
ncbi:conserved hypothetical protein [Methanocaldococcus jannaschii DSM 2661]|uniref:Uncharacterized protein MJ1393 n=2 Tax=Methanocaldococcus jannaschii TaxID=2190 RepID=Y1393_METJA|nr:hypothetical protein [Methanocaldococcus jannaschii]Q58788.3 RecName: Full=Uncharacterized protein MJ1393 [Methanocaldococcus jannaschii DSM 2661]AAB99403.1 conserved hypothetical protein [Methanocaldococcus jannaschii DSM 2661]